jgi:thimet oligopeptidase
LDLTGQEVGAFFLDLFPRKGKFGHAAAFGIVEGRLKSNGVYQRPVKAMVCNFSAEAPHLLSHSEVETLFHEFGHIFHGVLTTARYVRFSGTGVAWDFVEAPSQIFENWAWEYEVLKTFARHSKDPNRVFSEDLVKKMNDAQRAGSGLFYLRQLSFAKADLRVHGPGRKPNVLEVINETVSRLFLPLPPDTAFGAGFGHMVGYASGYYGYAWADVIAADMFSLFKHRGLFDSELGLRLKKEIYEPGGSRDENVSLEKFLQRSLSYDAFFEGIGV